MWGLIVTSSHQSIINTIIAFSHTLSLLAMIKSKITEKGVDWKDEGSKITLENLSFLCHCHFL